MQSAVTTASLLAAEQAPPPSQDTSVLAVQGRLPTVNLMFVGPCIFVTTKE